MNVAHPFPSLTVSHFMHDAITPSCVGAGAGAPVGGVGGSTGVGSGNTYPAVDVHSCSGRGLASAMLQGGGAYVEAVVQETRAGLDDYRWVPGLQVELRQPGVARHECLAAGARRDEVPAVTCGDCLASGLSKAWRGDWGAGGRVEGQRDVGA